MNKKKELDLEDLASVTGGVTGGSNTCLYFIQALNKPATNSCDNCLYYNQSSLQSNEKECTHSAVNK